MSDALEDGWGEHTPPEDSLLRAHFLAFADYYVAYGHLHGLPTLSDDQIGAVDHPLQHLLLRAAVTRRPPPNPDALAARLDDFFSGDGAYSVFVPGQVPPPDGMEGAGHPPFMVRAVGAQPSQMPSDLRIEPVRDADRARDFERTLAHGYPIPELVDAEPGSGFGPRALDVPGLRLWVGYVGDQAVATSGVALAFGLNHVEWISTLPSARGRGYGEAMTWVATMADPGAPAVLIASDAGRPVYERMGYLTVLRCSVWLGPRR